MKDFLRKILKRGSVIGSSRDAGYLLYERFCNEVKSECAQPVFGNELPKMKPPYLKSSWNKFIEIFLPDNWCYIPKRKGYYIKKGFKELGYPGVLEYGWDEFLWEEEPFAFHMQGALKNGGVKDHKDDLSVLKEILERFIEHKK